MNVAITRSKRALYVLGHLKSLKVCPVLVFTADHEYLAFL